MIQRFFRIFVLALLTIALLGPSPSRAGDQELRSTIAFASTRDTENLPNNPVLIGRALEIYLITPPPDQDFPCDLNSCNLQRLTDNEFAEVFPVISPDGKKIVFESNRRGAGNTDLFVMNIDGTEQTFLTAGSSATWSPDSKSIAFHASASGTGELLAPAQPGSATSDSDIFVINVDDCLKYPEDCQNVEGPIKTNITDNGGTTIDEDADWSPAGDKIVFTRHDPGNYGADRTSAKFYLINPDGTGLDLLTVTDNDRDERAPEWSPNGDRILFSCRPEGGGALELCVMDKSGANRTQLTHTGVFHGTAAWSPDPGDERIVFTTRPGNTLTNELRMLDLTVDPGVETPLTDPPDPPGINWLPSWGLVRIPGQGEGQVAADGKDRAADKARGPAVDDGPGKKGAADRGKQHKDKGKKENKHKQRHGGGKRHR